jgi:hypothetical protein
MLYFSYVVSKVTRRGDAVSQHTMVFVRHAHEGDTFSRALTLAGDEPSVTVAAQ